MRHLTKEHGVHCEPRGRKWEGDVGDGRGSEVLFLLPEISRHISSFFHSFLVGQQVKLEWVAGHQHWSLA